MALDELFQGGSAARFMTESYTRLPFARPGGCEHLAALGSWAAVERLLAQPEANILIGQEGQSWSGSPPRSLADLRPLLAHGYTLGLRQAHRHDPALAALAGDFRRDFQAPIDIHLYCTPTGHPGFGWHYDAEDVFILQTLGTKAWSLRKNTVNPWPLVETIPANMRYEREMMPLMRCTLRAGDWLYIPNGFWHQTQAEDESISLSVGVRSPVALDLYDFLRQRLRESLRWRQRLPIQGNASPLSHEELFTQHHELAVELGKDLARALADEEFIRAFLAREGGKSHA
ncbi:MAG: cupin domain-containing protein [Gemmataceae bacterium]|nr:cupin domain-containing protein [Gemmataceae bacterium]